MSNGENKEAVQLVAEFHDVIRQIQLRKSIRADFKSKITKKGGVLALKITFSIKLGKISCIECNISQLRECYLPCYKGYLKQVCPMVAATA